MAAWQGLTSLVKALALIALVIGCFSASSSAGSSGPTHLPTHSPRPLLGWLLAFQAVVVTYDAWYTPMYFTEEDQDPTRSLALPRRHRSLMRRHVPADQWRADSCLGDGSIAACQSASGGALQTVFGGYGRQIFLVISIITVISANNASLLTAPRVLMAWRAISFCRAV